MKIQKADSLDFFNENVFRSILKRLEKINSDAARKWGEMDVAQMIHHLNVAVGSGLGYYLLADTGNFMTKSFNKWMILSVLKRFPAGSKTASTLKVTSPYDVDAEKQQLKEILEKAFDTKTNSDWNAHTYFGQLTRKQWGKLIVIHCNHHFQQFSN